MTNSVYEEFQSLSALQGMLEFYHRKQRKSLQNFFEPSVNGFKHAAEDQNPSRLSLSSSATCYLSTIRTGLEESGEGFLKDDNDCGAVITAIVERKWNSAQLEENNAFSTAFALEVIAEIAMLNVEEGYLPTTVTRSLTSDAPTTEFSPKIHAGLERLIGELIDGRTAVLADRSIDEVPRPHQPGSIAMSGYPESAYLTHLAWRAITKIYNLLSLPQFDGVVTRKTRKVVFKSIDRARLNIRGFARNEIHRQITLTLAKSKSADPFQLTYAILLDRACSPMDDVATDHLATIELGLKLFFDAQLSDGTWPRSQVLFHYPNVGNAYCYEYELFVQLLEFDGLSNALVKYLENFKRAVSFADRTRAGNPEAPVWSSNHHPQSVLAESWATACVYQAFFQIRNLASNRSRRLLFDEVGRPYKGFHEPATVFGDDLLDSELMIEGIPGAQSLKLVIERCIAGPIKHSLSSVSRGGSFSSEVPTGLLLFGPPGTSKTQLAVLIAKFLGWPQLTIDTSYFLRDGTANIQAQADRIFRMLEETDQLVVLLDEFDEMVRDRSSSPEVESRFLTTSMLPKLATLNSKRRLIYIVATNFVDQFDVAIRRGGRFDAIVQVMQPSFEAKIRKWPVLKDLLNSNSTHDRIEQSMIDDLTYLETVQLVKDYKEGIDAPVLKKRHVDHCTLQSIFNDKESTDTWSAVCGKQQQFTRIPNISALGNLSSGRVATRVGSSKRLRLTLRPAIE